MAGGWVGLKHLRLLLKLTSFVFDEVPPWAVGLNFAGDRGGYLCGCLPQRAAGRFLTFCECHGASTEVCWCLFGTLTFLAVGKHGLAEPQARHVVS